MVSATRHRALLAALVVGLTMATTACAAEAPNEDASAESDFTVDLARSEEHLARAVQMAERIEAGPGQSHCEEEVDRFGVIQELRAAIAVRDTVFFRTRVIAKKAVLARVLAGTLEWQEILGGYVPSKPETLDAALATGVSIWANHGGAYGPQRRIQFRADGAASSFVLDIERPGSHWDEHPTTWRLDDHRRLTLGTGEVFELVHDGVSLRATPLGEDYPTFVSLTLECDL